MAHSWSWFLPLQPGAGKCSGLADTVLQPWHFDPFHDMECSNSAPWLLRCNWLWALPGICQFMSGQDPSMASMATELWTKCDWLIGQNEWPECKAAVVSMQNSAELSNQECGKKMPFITGNKCFCGSQCMHTPWILLSYIWIKSSSFYYRSSYLLIIF